MPAVHGWKSAWAGSIRNRGWAVRGDRGVVLSPGLGPQLQAWCGTPYKLRSKIIKIPPALFGNPVRVDLMQRLLEWESASRRKPAVKTKTRGEVKATSKKPFRQKGTGNARQGQVSSPLNRGGGKAHGKKNRSYEIAVNAAIRRASVRVALSTKFQEDGVIFWEKAHVDEPRTKKIVPMFNTTKAKSLLIVDGPWFSENFVLACRNLPNVKMVMPMNLGVGDLLRHEKVVITLPALKLLKLWLSKSRRSRFAWTNRVSKYINEDSEPKPQCKKGKTKAWKRLPLYRKEGVEYTDGTDKWAPRRRPNRFQIAKVKNRVKLLRGIRKKLRDQARKHLVELRKARAAPKFPALLPKKTVKKKRKTWRRK
eukprot:TRINITY_DN6538_c0_g1_i1.p1 TRINITY_DN6538_c0_g1~~TRINITY_DN6538_c0_g1_i1.p1  ORF type:complete len:366 (+),score=68.29 TRINITY_DN6538_c0_g1_i1:97-1194(+)